MTSPLESQLLGQTAHAQISFWHRIRALPVLEALPSSGAGTVADLGAGAGLLGRILRDARPDCRYAFYEPLESLAARLTADHGDEARLASATDVEQADVVTLLDVIEHIGDDRTALADVVDAMAPGARLVVTVPALPSLWSTWDEQLGHFRRYTTRSLRDTVAGLPVEVTECAYLFPELLPPAVVRRVRRRSSGRSGAPDAVKAVGAAADGAASDSDFPELPGPVNRVLLTVGRASYRLRRWWPAGTSAVLVARRMR